MFFRQLFEIIQEWASTIRWVKNFLNYEWKPEEIEKIVTKIFAASNPQLPHQKTVSRKTIRTLSRTHAVGGNSRAYSARRVIDKTY